MAESKNANTVTAIKGDAPEIEGIKATPADVNFFTGLFSVLPPGAPDVDWEKLASICKLKNVQVAKARFHQIRRKYGLGATPSPAKANGAGVPDKPSPPTPTKTNGGVKKAKAAPRARKTDGAPKKGKRTLKDLTVPDNDLDADEVPKKEETKEEDELAEDALQADIMSSFTRGATYNVPDDDDEGIA